MEQLLQCLRETDVEAKRQCRLMKGMEERVDSVDVVRLSNIVHYVIARVDPSRLGATKLNKVLWFADIEHYRRYGCSLTGLQEYVRLPAGPVPRPIDHVLLRLKATGKVAERPVKVYQRVRREFVHLREPDVSSFEAREVDLLNEVMDAVCQHSANFVSEATHDALWEELENGESMPVRLGAIIGKTPEAKHLEWAKNVLPS